MPDWFTDKYGRVHAVRNSPGYEQAFEGLHAKDKDYLRTEPDGGYTHTADRAERAERVATLKPAVHSSRRLSVEAQETIIARLDKPRHRSKIY